MQHPPNWTSTKNFQIYKLDLEKTEEPEVKFPTSVGSKKKQEKNIYFNLIDYAKAFDVSITTNYRKFLNWREYHQISLPASWEICMQVKKQPVADSFWYLAKLIQLCKV